MNNHGVVVLLIFELLGLLVLDVVAGVNDELGKLAVIFMVGILLGWLMIHSAKLSGWIAKGASGGSGGGTNNSGGIVFV
jgi:hypothetical protein